MLNEELDVVAYAFAGIVVIFGVVMLGLWIQLRGLKKKMRKFTADTGVANLDEVISSLHLKIGQQAEAIDSYTKRLDDIEKMLRTVKGCTSLIRYNAFSETGNNLSFSLAILDRSQNGIVLSSIYNREDSYVYAKPVANGTSTYALSPEEKAAIAQALEIEAERS